MDQPQLSLPAIAAAAPEATSHTANTSPSHTTSPTSIASSTTPTTTTPATTASSTATKASINHHRSHNSDNNNSHHSNDHDRNDLYHHDRQYHDHLDSHTVHDTDNNPASIQSSFTTQRRSIHSHSHPHPHPHSHSHSHSHSHHHHHRRNHNSSFQHHSHDNYSGSAPTSRKDRDIDDYRRSDEADSSRLVQMTTALAGNTVSPFLQDHIPSLYAPVGKPDLSITGFVRKDKDPNSKFCYRHAPGSKCRRAADETKMAMIQNELDKLPPNDQQAITHVWSLFSAAPSKHRELMLQGIITQCCFPQLSTVSREVHEQLKIDFISALPPEISYKVLCFLDTVSLCKAAQVNRRWRELADDDHVWHRMCSQHIDRKCTKCGWGLPLLERKRLQEWKPQTNAPVIDVTDQHDADTENNGITNNDTADLGAGANKRKRSEADCERRVVQNKKRREEERRLWKDVYRERFEVGSNWKYGRCSIKILRGHQNGVTCLQFDDNILATGSYDSTIKIWNVQTGELIRTLTGHTSGVRTLQFHGAKLISGSLDKTIKVWNWNTGECINTMAPHQDGVITLHFVDNWLASGSIDKTVKLFNFHTRQSWCLRGHTDWVNHVRIDIQSRTIFSSSDDLTIRMWDMDTQECLKTYHGHVGQVQQVLLMPEDFEPDEITNMDDTASVSSSSRDCSPVPMHQHMGSHGPKINGLDDGQKHSSYSNSSPPPDMRAIFGHCFEEDLARPLPPSYMLSAGLDNTIRLWNVATGRCLRTMFGHVEGIWSLTGDTLRVVTGANDFLVKVWEPRSGKCERTFAGHSGPATCVGLSDSRMASGSEDGEVRLYTFEGNTKALVECGTPS
ncbi:putative E3 ubiquitin ligase complex SCF subunit scon-2 [Ceratocystis fimbriata CBS 114723]|uniref:Putative E3 ubiquitin ligase complex SCF subunit scon-2 n=1 Tax=Ceratocystis fimbriata CBS 114723 TaxID=1035309 RepID=A0A2C5WUT0_9PEZI|nr:putative E3 ubiquitin ligase complex SCF subunit scon-2 [Ceratocystis fimbriata CBS 114723]